MDRYNKLNAYYKQKFGERVLKICVDGGFTCPNRDGSKGIGGCAFCSLKGSGEHIKYNSVTEQVKTHLNSYRGKRADKFIVYFQNFSNTYAPIDKLKQVYDSALISDKIIGISIATRPDCINKEIVELLKTYKSKYFVMVELGLQTADENISKNLNLGYTVKEFKNACKLLKEAGIEVVAHMIVGLCGETIKSLDSTIKVVNNSGCDGVKIHNLYIVKGSKFEELYKKGELRVLEIDEYLEKLEYILKNIKPNIIIHRISGDAPKDLLEAPEWNGRKKLILNGIEKRMKEHNTYQGCEFVN